MSTDPSPLTVDDFHEFFTGTYRPVLDALDTAGMVVSIEAGATGHYLLVVRPAISPDTSATTVEVTAANQPLPAFPDDTDTWLLTTPTTRQLVSHTTPEALAAAILAILGPS